MFDPMELSLVAGRELGLVAVTELGVESAACGAPPDDAGLECDFRRFIIMSIVRKRNNSSKPWLHSIVRHRDVMDRRT